jgi:hypothetical protein
MTKEDANAIVTRFTNYNGDIPKVMNWKDVAMSELMEYKQDISQIEAVILKK